MRLSEMENGSKKCCGWPGWTEMGRELLQQNTVHKGHTN